MFKAYSKLSPAARVGLGFGIIGWGVAGNALANRVEEKYEAPKKDKDHIESLVPKVTVVDKSQ